MDVARFGNDSTVIFKRQGLVAFEPIIIKKFDSVQVADIVAMHIDKDKPDAVFVDSGQGQGVIDHLRRSLGYKVTEVPFGASAIDAEHYANRRIEMWDKMAQWLRDGGAIPPNTLLQADLTAPTYGYTVGKNLKILESKDKIKERIGRSPDLADALALTFAAPVRSRHEKQKIQGKGKAYDPMRAFEQQWRK